jgi:EpsI family protein
VNALVRPDDSYWNQVTTGVARSGGGGVEVHWRTARILGKSSSNNSRTELAAWRVYWVDGRWIPGDIRAKLAGVVQRLQGRGDDGAVLVLSTDNPSQAAADALLQQFTRDNLSALQTLLHETQARR